MKTLRIKKVLSQSDAIRTRKQIAHAMLESDMYDVTEAVACLVALGMEVTDIYQMESYKLLANFHCVHFDAMPKGVAERVKEATAKFCNL